MLRDDINPAATWVTADTHFGHQNIIGFCNRPPDHEQIMLEECARTVPPNHTLLHLGDLAYRGNAFFKNIISPHLTDESVRRLLIRGNHDRGRFSFYRQCDFHIVRPFEISWNGWVISLSHYPWNEAFESGPQPANTIRIHGHIHNNGYTREAYVPFFKNHINVSVEQTHYRPVNLELLLQGYLNGELP